MRIFLVLVLLLLPITPASAAEFFPIGNFTSSRGTVLVGEVAGNLQVRPTAPGASAAGSLGFKGGTAQLYGHAKTTSYGAEGYLAGLRYSFNGNWGPVTWLLAFDASAGKLGGALAGGMVFPVGLGFRTKAFQAQAVATVGGMAGAKAPGGVSRGYLQARLPLSDTVHVVAEYLLTAIDANKNFDRLAPVLSLGIGYTGRGSESYF